MNERLFATRADAPRRTLKEMVGKRLKRWTLDKRDRDKVFPGDKDILTIAAHPDGEVAGYVAWFEKHNALKVTR